MRSKRLPVVEVNTIFFAVTALSIFIGNPMSIVLGLSNGSRWMNYLLILIDQLIFVLLPVVLYLNYKAKTVDIRKVLRLNPIKPAVTMLVILIAVCTNYIIGFLDILTVYLLGFIGEVPSFPLNPAPDAFHLAASLVIASLVPSICEEILHRGIIMNSYEIRGSMKAVVVSAMFFGIFHYDIRNFLSPIVFGLIIGYVVIKADSLYAGILAHFVNNAMTEIMQFFTSQGIMPDVDVRLQELLMSIPVTLVAGILLAAFLKIFASTANTEYSPSIATVKNDVVAILSHWPVALSLVMYLSIATTFVFTMLYR